MSANTYKEIYSPHELCALLNLSYKTILKLIDVGAIPAIRLGGQFRISRDALERMLQEGSEQGKQRV